MEPHSGAGDPTHQEGHCGKRKVNMDRQDGERLQNSEEHNARTNISITPFAERKTLRLIIDRVGVGFVLFNGFMKWILQGAVIVNANCSRFKESQLRFSPIEGEAKAL